MTGFLSRIGSLLAAPFRRLTGGKAPLVTLVRLEGVIAPEGAGPRGGRNLSLNGVEKMLDRAFAPKKAQAVAIVINSPGGSPVQARLIHDRIRALSEEKKKPVLVFCEDVAASGGYMIACAGDEIIVDPGSIIGSIGVVSAGFGFNEAMARLGVERRLKTAGKLKALADPFSPEDETQKARLQRIMQRIHEDFAELVRERRSEKLNPKDADLFEGEVYVGVEALKAGLADSLGEARSVLRRRYGDKVRIAAVPGPKPGLLARLTGGLSEQLVAAVESRAAWARWGL
ncbi:MAG: S49 family peptidase [Maricaulaceae bacterium]|nr:S49 family peptidase [Maricaulaceae bacterium]